MREGAGHFLGVVGKSYYIFTTGDICEQTAFGLRHGSISFGLEPSESWYGLYTTSSSAGKNTGYDVNSSFISACLSACSVMLQRSSSKAIWKLSRAICVISSVSAVLRFLLFFLHGEYREFYRLEVKVVHRT